MLGLEYKNRDDGTTMGGRRVYGLLKCPEISDEKRLFTWQSGFMIYSHVRIDHPELSLIGALRTYFATNSSKWWFAGLARADGEHHLYVYAFLRHACSKEPRITCASRLATYQ